MLVENSPELFAFVLRQLRVALLFVESKSKLESLWGAEFGIDGIENLKNSHEHGSSFWRLGIVMRTWGPRNRLVLNLLLRELVQKVKGSTQVPEVKSERKVVATARSGNIEFVSERPKVRNKLFVLRKRWTHRETVFGRLLLDLG